MDLLQFRSVCMPWRAAGTPDPKLGPRVIDHRFHPRHWILVPLPEEAAPAGATRRQLLNVTTRKLVQVHLPPKLAVVEGPSGAPEGMLVLRDDRTLVVRLLNPVTGHVVDLPSLRTLQRGRRRGPIPRAFKADYEVTAAGFAGGYSTVVVYLGYVNRMAMAKPGDKRWTLVNNLFGLHAGPVPDYPSLSSATFQGRFYCFDSNGISVVDVARRRLQLLAAIPISWFIKFIGSASMVDHGGDLMLVWPSSRITPVFGHDGQLKSRAKVTRIELFHVDLENGRLLPVRDLGEDAVFVGSLGAVLLPNARHCRSSSVHANTVYFKFNMRERDFGAFQLSTNHEANDLPRVEECTFARHIASYVTSTRRV
ncbi:hypothetical protein BS78_02G390900 [Paspalum vaginatum]|nr:hypothetical protein BS78_02G390900 [Paspalum vaginatum]